MQIRKTKFLDSLYVARYLQGRFGQRLLSGHWEKEG